MKIPQPTNRRNSNNTSGDDDGTGERTIFVFFSALPVSQFPIHTIIIEPFK